MGEARTRRAVAPPGRMVDIGGRRIHVTIAGSGQPPAVVIIPGIGGTTADWAHIQLEAARHTTVCVYDRPGTGWSDPPAGKRLAPGGMAADLAAGLAAAGLAGPWLLAGHSFGGIIARQLWAAHPGNVAAMLLIDSSHEGQAHHLPASGRRQAAALRLGQLRCWHAAILGTRRLAFVSGLPGPAAPAVRADARQAAARAVSSRHRHTAARETALLTRLRGEPPDLGSLPLTVLTSASRPWPGYPQWAILQEELAALSADSRHLIAGHAGHHIHRDDPALVIGALTDLLARTRHTQSHPGTKQ